MANEHDPSKTAEAPPAADLNHPADETEQEVLSDAGGQNADSPVNRPTPPTRNTRFDGAGNVKISADEQADLDRKARAVERCKNKDQRIAFATLQTHLRAAGKKVEHLLDQGADLMSTVQEQMDLTRPVSDAILNMSQATIGKLNTAYQKVHDLTNETLEEAYKQASFKGERGEKLLNKFTDKLTSDADKWGEDQHLAVIQLNALMVNSKDYNHELLQRNAEDSAEGDLEEDANDSASSFEQTLPKKKKKSPKKREQFYENLSKSQRSHAISDNSDDNESTGLSIRVTGVDAVPPTEAAPQEEIVEDLREDLSQMRRTMLKLTGDAISADRNAEKIRLPTVKIPRFSGEITKWPEFWEAFYAVVGRRADVPDFQKLLTLRKSLDGEAEQALEGFALDASTYLAQVDRLKARYGDRRLLVGKIIRKILFKPQCTKISLAGPFISFMTAQLRILETLGLSLEDNNLNMVLLSVIQSKCPTDITVKFENDFRSQELEKGKCKPKIEEASAPLSIPCKAAKFLSFCEQRMKAMDSSRTIFEDGKFGTSEAAKAITPPRHPRSTKKINANSGFQTQKKIQPKTNRQWKSRSPAPKPSWAQVAARRPAPKKTNAFVKRPPRPQPSAARKPQPSAARKPQPYAAKKSQPPAAKPRKPSSKRANMNVEHFGSGCIWCGGPHVTTGCKKHVSMSIPEKWTRIRTRAVEKGAICFRCLNGNHVPSECRLGPCGLAGCTKRHNPALCLANNK
jgi:hypothetical protein